MDLVRSLLQEYYPTLIAKDVKDVSPLPGANKNSENYLVTSSEGKLFLLRKYLLLQDEEVLLRILDILQFCREEGQPVPHAIRNKSKKYLTKDNGGIFALFTYLPGSHSTGTEEQLQDLARSLAKLHQVLQRCTLPAPQEEDSAYALLTSQELHALQEELPPADFNLLREELKIQGQSTDDLPRQLIHRDLHPQNILFQDDKVSGFLDFDGMVSSERIRDIAFCAFRHALLTTSEPSVIQGKIGQFLQRYEKISPLLPEEKAAIPFILKNESLKRLSYIFHQLEATGRSAWQSDMEKHLSHLRLINSIYSEADGKRKHLHNL